MNPTETETFNPKGLDLDSPNVRVTVEIDREEGTANLVVVWMHNHLVSRDSESNQRPEWADLPWKERVLFTLSGFNSTVVANALAQGQLADNLAMELPCPPYNYEVEGMHLVISKGGLRKRGTKQEFQDFIDDLQGQVNDMPEGINVEHMPDVTLEVMVKHWTSVDISVDKLLQHADEYEDGMWNGTKDELEYALQDAIDQLDSDEFEIDLSYEAIDEVEVNGTDLDYCMRQV